MNNQEETEKLRSIDACIVLQVTASGRLVIMSINRKKTEEKQGAGEGGQAAGAPKGCKRSTNITEKK